MPLELSEHDQPKINPIAAISAASMMMEMLGEEAIAKNIENAMIKVMGQMKSMSAGKMGMSTSDVGDKIAKFCL